MKLDPTYLTPYMKPNSKRITGPNVRATIIKLLKKRERRVSPCGLGGGNSFADKIPTDRWKRKNVNETTTEIR